MNDINTTTLSRGGGPGDLSSYPILTEQVNFPSAPAAGTPAAPTGALGGNLSLQQVVDGALRDVLGWRPKTPDNKGFVAALNQSFDLKEVEGHVEWKWNQRSYLGQVETDLGAVTGAQASIYTRAKAAIDQSLPLLSGLSPLAIDVAQEDIESIRTIIRTEMIELVKHFGTVGGPPVFLVDNLFRLLIGRDPFGSPEEVGGNLRILRDRLGLSRNMVNSLENEQNYTNFLILVDYIVSLKQSWDGYRQYFSRSPSVQPYLGTQLVLFSRALTAINEAVQDVYFTMDSVFLGPAERQTLQLNFAGHTITPLPAVTGDNDFTRNKDVQQNKDVLSYTFDSDAAPLYVSELMDSVTQTVQQATDMVQDTGKDGVIAVFSTLVMLRKYVRGALTAWKGGVQATNTGVSTGDVPAGYKTDRVQRAIQELADQLDNAAELAGQITSKSQTAREKLQDITVLDALRDLLCQISPNTPITVKGLQEALNQIDPASECKPNC